MCALVCLHGCVTLAQDADAPARARRDADNPLRMIIEASKIKPRQKAVEAEPASVDLPFNLGWALTLSWI